MRAIDKSILAGIVLFALVDSSEAQNADRETTLRWITENIDKCASRFEGTSELRVTSLRIANVNKTSVVIAIDEHSYSPTDQTISRRRVDFPLAQMSATVKIDTATRESKPTNKLRFMCINSYDCIGSGEYLRVTASGANPGLQLTHAIASLAIQQFENGWKKLPDSAVQVGYERELSEVGLPTHIRRDSEFVLDCQDQQFAPRIRNAFQRLIALGGGSSEPEPF